MTKGIFSGKTVIITGGAKGIGAGIARAYAAADASVVIADVLDRQGEEIAQELSQQTKAFFIPCDISESRQIAEMISRAYQSAGSIDILINNAGISESKSPLELRVDEWDRVLNTNLRGAFLCAREAASYMKSRGGKIVNIASTRAFMSEPGWEAYAASKGGIVAVTHALAISLATYRIQVNCISPGWIMTGEYSELREIDHRQHPSGRVGKPEDIARACFFLTDPQNDFITGENLVIDGGMTRKMIYEE